MRIFAKNGNIDARRKYRFHRDEQLQVFLTGRILTTEKKMDTLRVSE